MVGRGTQGGQTHGGRVYCGPVEQGGTPTHAVGGGGGGGTGERSEEIRTRAILRASESQMGRCAKAEEAENIKEQIGLALE